MMFEKTYSYMYEYDIGSVSMCYIHCFVLFMKLVFHCFDVRVVLCGVLGSDPGEHVSSVLLLPIPTQLIMLHV